MTHISMQNCRNGAENAQIVVEIFPKKDVKKAPATPKIFQVYKSNFFQRFSFLISIAKIGTENSATLQHQISAKDKLFHFVKSEDSLGRWVDGGFFI